MKRDRFRPGDAVKYRDRPYLVLWGGESPDGTGRQYGLVTRTGEFVPGKPVPESELSRNGKRDQNMKLYEIAEDLRSTLDDLAAETEPDSLDSIEAYLNQIEIDFAEKLDGCASYIAEMNAEREVLAAEIQRLQNRKKSVENAILRFKAYILGCLQSSGQRKVKTALFTISVRKGVERLTELETDEEFARVVAAVPAGYLKVETKILRGALLQAIKGGQYEVPEHLSELLAIVRGPETLSIR